MDKLFRVLAGLFAILFAISAILQYNDPDAWVWILIWTLAATVSLAFVFDKVGVAPPLILGVFCLLGFFYVYPDQFEGFEIGKGDIVNIERGREAYGLLIMALVMFMIVFRLKYKRFLKI